MPLKTSEVRLRRQRAYYRENRAVILEKNSEAFAEFTEWLQILRTLNGCDDCGTHVDSLEHHHVDPSTKKYVISHMYTLSLDTLEDELEKCVVLCAPCHDERHRILEDVKNFKLLAMEEMGEAEEPLCSLPTLFTGNRKRQSS